LGLWGPGKERNRVSARSLLCYWAVEGLGLSMAELSRKLGLSLSGVSQSVKRNEKMAENTAYKLNEIQNYKCKGRPTFHLTHSALRS